MLTVIRAKDAGGFVRIWKIPGQVIRLAMLFALAAVLTLLLRAQFVPDSFGETGHYRADAIPLIEAQPIRYAGLEACAECHDDVAELKAGSYHRGLACEGCHGAAAGHVEDPVEHRPGVPTGRDACLRCHAYQASRPTGFPQVLQAVHNPMEPCASCHDPHEPTPPLIPGDCSACHRHIARTKSVSHHWSLDCETCHETPPEHLEHPRAHPPGKPAERRFCGQCHAEGAGGAAGVPRVDMAAHGSRYRCWQCHYPHDPEGR